MLQWLCFAYISCVFILLDIAIKHNQRYYKMYTIMYQHLYYYHKHISSLIRPMP